MIFFNFSIKTYSNVADLCHTPVVICVLYLLNYEFIKFSIKYIATTLEKFPGKIS
jgi:hypothetical protein